MDDNSPYGKGLKVIFEILVDAALDGARCPTTSGKARDGTPTLREAFEKRAPPGAAFYANALNALAERGLIRIEIWAHNWRVVEICGGEHIGRRTKESPLPGARKIYKTVTAETRSSS